MWKPTAGRITGFMQYQRYTKVFFRSHTGKAFDIKMPHEEVADKKIGDAIFCNGEICKWHPSWESAINRLNTQK